MPESHQASISVIGPSSRSTSFQDIGLLLIQGLHWLSAIWLLASRHTLGQLLQAPASLLQYSTHPVESLDMTLKAKALNAKQYAPDYIVSVRQRQLGFTLPDQSCHPAHLQLSALAQVASGEGSLADQHRGCDHMTLRPRHTLWGHTARWCKESAWPGKPLSLLSGPAGLTNQGCAVV